LVMTASGQYSQQRKQVGLLSLLAVHFVSSITGTLGKLFPQRHPEFELEAADGT